MTTTLAPPVEPLPLDTSALRRQGRSLLRAAALFVVPLAVLLSLAMAEQRVWGPLTRDGARAPAQVVGGSHWRLSDRIRVAFATPDGQLVEASVPVSDLQRYDLGSTVEVAFDPSNPRRARTVEDWSPPYVIPAGIAALLALVSLLLAWRSWRWPARLRRLATEAPRGVRMVLSTVSAGGRVPGRWAVLWEPGMAPASPPQLAFRVADAEEPSAELVDVELVGERRRRMVGFLKTPTGVMWPSGTIRRPTKSVRRAVERAAAAVPVPATYAGQPPNLPVLTLPDARGGLPPLPPDLFAKPDRASDLRPGKLLVVLATLLLGVSVPLVLPEVVEAHRRICPSPPAAAAGEPGLLPDAALPGTLPAQLDGYELARERARPTPWFDDPARVTALVNAGYSSGFERDFVTADVRATVEVFQFKTDLGPLRYEAQRLATLCAFKHGGLSVPDRSGASGAIIRGKPDTYRLTFVRGNRDYIVSIEGVGVSEPSAVLQRVLQTAR
jgi:hypothetical protein